jgi:hypothetical protein
LLIISSIILVPDVDSRKGRELELSVASFARLAPAALVLRFEYEISIDVGSIWNTLIQKGECLLNELVNSRHLVSFQAPKIRKGNTQPLHQVQHRPMIFVCYGLGGLILKKVNRY